MNVSTFGVLPDGREVKAFQLSNSRGIEVTLLELGCIVESLRVPDRNDEQEEVTLGYDTLEDWLKNENYFGAIIGRVAGRIGGAKFPLEGRDIQLAANRVTDTERCHIHGGETGLSRRLWEGKPLEGEGVELSYFSPDGEEGYPGNLKMKVTYRLDASNRLSLDMEAETDALTPVNLANHTYWNLSGNTEQSIEGHRLTLAGDRFLEIGDGLIPSGAILDVEGTPLDFRKPHIIGERIQSDTLQMKRAGGYDHYWIFPEQEGLQFAAKVVEPDSGRAMELYTNQPGVVFYTGNFLGKKPGKFRGGAKYPPRGGFCLETQGYPDAPNHPEFPSCLLRPGVPYKHQMVFRFSTE